MTDLSLASVDELLDELANRHDALVVLMENDKTTTNTSWRRHWSGPPSRLIGMLLRALSVAMRDDPGSQ